MRWNELCHPTALYLRLQQRCGVSVPSVGVGRSTHFALAVTMARNEEKANAVLNRFWAAKQDEKRKPKQKRPYLASECRDLADADKWRQQILREIGRKVMEIQNPGLGEHRIKDLNDEINKLIREKGHWETRIVELGGPNYAKQAPKLEGDEGEEGDKGADVEATGKGLG